MPRCSVIIRCYNEEEHIGRLLSGIMEQTIIDDTEIIVVDSGSTDATVSIASHFPTKIVSITPEEFSFGRALNIGCDEASGEICVFASAHVYPVYQDWLERMVAPFIDPEVALVYGKQRGNEITKYSEHQVFAKWFPETSDRDQDHPFCNNANAAIRRSVWKSIPYDESLTGLEDLDWAKKAKQREYRIVYDTNAEIIHVHDEEPSGIMNRYRREAIALKEILPTESFTFWDFVRLFVGNTFSDCYHAWHDGILFRNIKSILVFRLMQFWGSYRGFQHRGDVGNRLKRRFYYPNQIERSSSPNRATDPEEKDVEGDQIRYETITEQWDESSILLQSSSSLKR